MTNYFIYFFNSISTIVGYLMNKIARLEIELACYDVAVQRVG